MNKKIAAIIPAAGEGSRMQLSVKKPYLRLGKKPILSHTIDRFEQHSAIDEIFVVVDSTDFTMCRTTILDPYRYQKVRELVPGGETRQMSVFNALRTLADDVDVVLVHDGVRPFVTEAVIFECLTATAEWGAAVTAVPVKETIKVANEELFVVDTPERHRLWRVQTPQGFRKSLLVEAHEKARRNSITATDDAALVEQLGHPIKLITGSYRNIKLTTLEDLRIAETLLTDAI